MTPHDIVSTLLSVATLGAVVYAITKLQWIADNMSRRRQVRTPRKRNTTTTTTTNQLTQQES